MNTDLPHELKTQKPNYWKFNREEDKPCYAAYLNTAKQNIFIILWDISDHLQMGFNAEDDGKLFSTNLWRILKSNEKPEITQKIIELLNNQFTFLKYIAINHAKNRTNSNESTPTSEDYYDVLRLWIRTLLDYRNNYSHALHIPVKMNLTVLDGMRNLYDADHKRFKEQFSLNDHDVKHLLRLGKNGERKNFRYAFRDKHGLTEKGFLYFLCLWLEKKQAQELLKKHEGFKRSELKLEKATLEKFTWFRTIVPKPRLVSDHSKQGLFMDMVNELKRCPMELYKCLNETDRQKFIPEDLNDENFDSSEYESVPILIRKNNRFFYFALRFLEYSFQNLKFHIDLGNYCFKTYEQLIEDVPRKRRWIKRITTFGNLKDFHEHNRPEGWEKKLFKLKDKEAPETYITQTTPHYHFDPSSDVKNIGLKWVEKYDKSNPWPEIPEGLGIKPEGESPDFWLSLYELPSVVFYQWLHENGLIERSAEKEIKIYKQKVNGFLTQVSTGNLSPGFTNGSLNVELNKRGLNINSIPKSVKKHLLSQKSPSMAEKAGERLKKLKEENDRLLSKVERQEGHFREKPGSKNYIELKPGQMADFLARDMILLQKPINQDQGKPNSTEFQVLQAKLAYFGKNQETLSDTFKLCNLIKSANPHPFLHKIEIQNCKGILDFYIRYLRFRRSFIEKCLKEGNFVHYHFLKLGEENKNIQKLISEQQNAVMNLPRGLFLKPILNALRAAEDSESIAKILEDKERVNFSYVIKTYFDQVRKDQNQDFYEFKRKYDLLDDLFGTKDRRLEKKRPEHYFSLKDLTEMKEDIQQKLEKAIVLKIKRKDYPSEQEKEHIKNVYKRKYKQFIENEKQIRLFKTCDIVLFLMVDYIYQKGNFLFDQDKKAKKKPLQKLELCDKYKLREIKPNAKKGLLSETVGVRLRVYYPENEKTHSKIIIRENMKIKNYGDFRAFLKDRRIYGLLPYIKEEEIQYEALKQELEEFEKSRFIIFKKILEFENALIASKRLELGANDYISHKFILGKLENSISDNKLKEMMELRNVFFHNQYPDSSIFKDRIDGSGFNFLKKYRKNDESIREKSIILQFQKLANDYYNEAIRTNTKLKVHES